MSVKRIIGTFHIGGALLAGYWGLQVSFSPSNGGRLFWWPLTMLGASILLLVGGVRVLFSRVGNGWLVGLAAVVPLVIWIGLIRGFSWVCCVFTAAVVLIAWGALALASTLKRTGIASVVASLVMAIAWLPGSLDAFHDYLFPDPPAINPPVLLPLVILCALIIALVASGLVLVRAEGTVVESGDAGY